MHNCSCVTDICVGGCGPPNVGFGLVDKVGSTTAAGGQGRGKSSKSDIIAM